MVNRLDQLVLQNFRAKKSVWVYVFQFGWGVKTFDFNEIFCDNSFVFDSTGFDLMFAALVDAR